MQHPFEALQPEYANLLARMRIMRQSDVTIAAGRLLGFVKEGKYKAVADQLGIPQIFIATSFDREASSNFNLSPAQGDPWNHVSVHVPKGLGPYDSWPSAAVDTYTREGLQKIGLKNWTWARFCYEGELFNGFGYRNYGVNTPYDWAGTNDYIAGKYVADGAFDRGAVDQQLGIVPVARIMASALPELDIPDWPAQRPVPMPLPQYPPGGVGGGLSVEALQKDLNVLLKLDPPLVVDNSYGRRTKAAVVLFQQAHSLAVDGLAGPLTNAAVQKAMEG